jgi:tRNA pseudouridine38-40 synthase
LRVERRIADEERLENRDEGDRRLPKRRCALLMGYCGSGYSGMQMYVASEPHTVTEDCADDTARTTSILSKERCSKLL